MQIQQQQHKIVTIVAMSDTHDVHHKINLKALPPGDIFIHAGDFTKFSRPNQLKNFRDFLTLLPYKYKVVIAGNHDFVFDRQNYIKGRKFQKTKHKDIQPPLDPQQQIKKLKEVCIYLQHQLVQIQGLRIFGSPYSPQFYDWGFMYSQSNSQKLWSTIPKDIDILITHGPPYKIQDLTVNKINAGCKGLLKMIQILKPQVHIFGHIHEAYGQKKVNDTLFINASNVNFAYKLANQPVVAKVKAKKRDKNINIQQGKQVKIVNIQQYLKLDAAQQQKIEQL